MKSESEKAGNGVDIPKLVVPSQQAPQVQPQQLYGVPAVVLKATIEVLETELPMKKVRPLVEALEQSVLMNVNVDDGHSGDDNE